MAELVIENPVESLAPGSAAGQLRRQRVVIIGGGFGGLNATRALRRVNVEVALVDRRNFHLFQPLLYQVATGGLSPANIAAPLRSILRRQKNLSIYLGDVVGVDVKRKMIEFQETDPVGGTTLQTRLAYDWLIVAAGAGHSYFGNDQWQQYAPGLKTIEDATEIRRRIFSAFEAAEHEFEPRRRAALMTFVVVGGGPTGVELAGAIAELARQTLRNDFRNINPSDAQIIIVDAQDRVLAGFSSVLSGKAESSLARLEIQIRTGAMVTAIRDDAVELQANDRTEVIHSHTILWAAGVGGVPLGKTLAQATGAHVNRAGQVPVEGNLSVAGYPNIFVIGDLALCPDALGNPLPGVAPVAMQQGRYVGRLIASQIRGKDPPPAFEYRDPGSMATIGRRAAVAELGELKFGGLFAWLLWLLVHIRSITQFQNRVLVFFQWAWNYFTFNRSARLITESRREAVRGKNPPPDASTNGP